VHEERVSTALLKRKIVLLYFRTVHYKMTEIDFVKEFNGALRVVTE